jgi:hypothetical protein
MGLYYCSRADITDLLESLTGSEIATTAQQDSKLREPASRWIDSVYPTLAPFQGVPAGDPQGWLVTQTDHDGGDSTVTISDGSGTPAVGDIFRPQIAGQWDQDDDAINAADTLTRPYRVTAYSAPTLTYEPAAEDDFPQGTPLYFGPPTLVRQACRLYGVALAYQILRRNPLDPLAEAMFAKARELLWIPKGGHVARAQPETGMSANLTSWPVVSA